VQLLLRGEVSHPVSMTFLRSSLHGPFQVREREREGERGRERELIMERYSIKGGSRDLLLGSVTGSVSPCVAAAAFR
jgi:hypothetical protein